MRISPGTTVYCDAVDFTQSRKEAKKPFGPKIRGIRARSSRQDAFDHDEIVVGPGWLQR
jgi:hypothetical protein